MNIQVRIRTDESFSRISYIKDWLNETPRGLAFEHNKPGNHHYHLYLFGLERNCDAMRRHLGKHLPKECYAVGITAGKKKVKITPEYAYQYGTTKSLNNPIWTKGFPLEELETYHKNAEKFYKVPIVVSDTDAKLPEVIYKVDRVWEKLRDHKDEYKDMSIARIKSKISADYLNNGKAIPRSADLHRYAISLYYLNLYVGEDRHGFVTDTALEEYYINTRT